MEVGLNHSRSICVDIGLTAGAAAVSSLVPAGPFKYLYTTELLQSSVSSLTGPQETISEFDNYLYHSVLLLLFKGLLGASPLNSEFILTSLSSPLIQRSIVNSPQFQRAKLSIAIKLLRAIGDQKKSIGKSIAIRWLKSYLLATPAACLLRNINFGSTPAEMVTVFKHEAIDLYRKKRDESLYLTSEITDQVRALAHGQIDKDGLDDLMMGSFKLMEEFGLEQPKQCALSLSVHGLAYVVGTVSLNTIATPLAIIANSSKYPSLREVTIRAIGTVAAISIKGIVPLIVTEGIVAFIPRASSDSGEIEIVPKATRIVKNTYDLVRRELRTEYGISQKTINKSERLALQTLIGSAMLVLRPTLSPSIHAFTNLHLINTLVPSRKIEVIDAMFVQSILAVGLTTIDALGGGSAAVRISVNSVAIILNHPFLMKKMIDNDVIKAGSKYIQDKVPGALVRNSYNQALSVSSILAPCSNLIERGVVILKIAKIAHVSKIVIDDLGGVERIRDGFRQAATSSMKFYLNYTVVNLASSVLGFPGSAIAVGVTTSGSKLSKAISAGTAGAIYYSTGSSVLTSLAVTVVQALGEFTIPATLTARVRGFFRQ